MKNTNNLKPTAMQPTIVKTSKSELCLWVAPDNTHPDIIITSANALSYEYDYNPMYDEFTMGLQKLPEGNWQLIGPLKDITEEVAKELVDRFRSGYPDYSLSNNPAELGRYCLNKAKNSLNSLVESKGLEGNVIILKRTA